MPAESSSSTNNLANKKSDTFEEQAKLILRLAVPSTLFGITRKSNEITNLIFIGTLNSKAMVAGVGMGNMITNLVAMSMFYGVNSALDTL